MKKWNYIIFNQAGEAFGTDDERQAQLYLEQVECTVLHIKEEGCLNLIKTEGGVFERYEVPPAEELREEELEEAEEEEEEEDD